MAIKAYYTPKLYSKYKGPYIVEPRTLIDPL